MNTLIQEIIRDPFSSLLIVANLFLIESLLSVDNAAVLATMVMGLPRNARAKALKYGLAGAYIFRGICLLLATYLIKIWWLKGVGGLYLVYLALNWFMRKRTSHNNDKPPAEARLYQLTVGRLGKFWATVISVEIMDLAFSLDNVFAAVAFSRNIIIILIGVFIGILAMRFVAQGFVRLMEKYAFLEGCAYTVIALLGVKLVLSFFTHFDTTGNIEAMLESRAMDWLTSALTIGIFFVPVLTSILFNFPRRHKTGQHDASAEAK